MADFQPPAKRQRLDTAATSGHEENGRSPRSLSHPISPPGTKRKARSDRALIPSPFRLTKIRDLSIHQNEGAVTLNDILGDPLIAECWEFNYLHDLDFLMKHFDEDTKSLVKVHVVHGFWKNEDPNRIALQEQAAQHSNVTLHTAFMPEMFGTHHSKILILLRHDDLAQVVIHTANMIAKDWTNMTNGVWQSPLLPLQQEPAQATGATGVFGSGERFQSDLLNYLRAYNSRRDVCKSLVDDLQKYDFSAVRGVLVGSVPGRHSVDSEPPETRWGWSGLKKALRQVPSEHEGQAEIVAQVSSIATLGPTENWLNRTLFDSLTGAPQPSQNKPDLKIVFPTPDEIRASLDGYASGGSIHTRIQSAQQAKQLQYMRPRFCHWANDVAKGIEAGDGPIQEAGRKRAAPHIKTYIRYNSSKSIDWALLTSANISKQAWGEGVNAYGEIRIASWELGVLVWPALLAEGDKTARMVATFKTDMPTPETSRGNHIDQGESHLSGRREQNTSGPLVGLRIPYSLPLKRYANDEVPWVASAQHREPDWMGQRWLC